MSLSPETKQVLLGSLLGDGSLSVCRRSANAHYEEMHSLAQRDYLLWKEDHLRKDFQTKLTEGAYFDENRLIKNYLQGRFGLEATIYPNSSRYEIRFDFESTKRLFSMIRCYALPCVLYKLGLDFFKEAETRRRARQWELLHKDRRKGQHRNWHRWPRTREEIDGLLGVLRRYAR